MARRKKTVSETVSESAPTPTPSTEETLPSETLTPKPSRRRTKKATVEPPPPGVEAAAGASAPEPKRTRRKKKTEAAIEPSPSTAPPEPETPAQPKRTRRKKSATPEMVVPEAVEVSPEAVQTEAVEVPPEAVQTDTVGVSPEAVLPEEAPKRRRRKATRQVEATPVAAEAPPLVEAPVAEEEAPPPAEEPKPRRRRRRAAPQVEAVPPVAEEPLAEGIAPPEAEPQVEVPPLPVEEVPPAVETPKPRRRRRKTAPPTEETAVAVAEPTVEVVPTPPSKPPIRHPLVRVHFHYGIPSITVGERTFVPFFFFGNLTHAEAGDYIHREMQLATDAGIDLFALLVPLPVRESGALEAFDQIRFWTAVAREVNPNAQILWRIVPAPVDDWQKEYPEAVVRYADGTIGGPSVCAERWWQQVKEQLVALVELMEREEEGGATLGYHLDWGEWFLPESGGYDTSEATLIAFRDWLRRHYKEDTVVLRSCWFDGDVSFSTATLPPFQPSSNPQRLQFYHLRREGRWIDYQRFISEITAKRILGLAQAVKEACQNRALVGVPYGYLLEWRHPYSGHLALSQLLKSEAIDFLSAPITYAERHPGKTGAFPVPLQSLHLHHKLYLSEEDYRTPFGKVSTLRDPATERSLSAVGDTEAALQDDYNPPLRNADEVLKVHARSVGQSLVYGYGTQWMDLWGEGWLLSPLAWEGARTQRQLWDWRTRVPQTPPDIAVMIDPVSMAYVRAGSRLLEQLIVRAREALLRSGVSFGFYLLDDLVRRDFPPVKVVLFLNAWRPSRLVRDAIRRKLQQGGRTTVWLYAGGLFQGHRDVLETAREITGLAIARQPWASTQGTQIVKPNHPIARMLGTDKLGTQEPWEPSYYVLDEDCEVLGEYIETGLTSFAVKDYGTWRTVFLGERVLTPELIRALARWAGVHVWVATNDSVHVNTPWLHIHAARGGRKTIALPQGTAVYDPAEGTILTGTNGTYEITLNEGESRLLLVDTPERLQALLRGESLPPVKVAEELPPLPPPEPTEEIPILAVEPEPTPPASRSYEQEPTKTDTKRRAHRTPKRKHEKPAPTATESVLAAVQWRRQPNEES